jgi:pseudouridine synthase
MGAERVQKLMARAGVCSRRQAEDLIRRGRVTINGEVATLGDKADPEADAIKVDGKRIQPPAQHRYLVLNKPAGFLSAVKDASGRPTVLDLVPPPLRKALVPVGRLDFNTEGLLLLTTDGDWAQEIAHPRYGCAKTYEVKVKGRPAEEALAKVRSGGMVIDGRPTRPCEVKPLPPPRAARGSSDNSWWRVVLHEGRTRQIREMFFRVGHPVQKLRRVAIGSFRDPALERGDWRPLEPREVERLRRRRSGRRKTGGRGKKKPRSGRAKGHRRGDR